MDKNEKVILFTCMDPKLHDQVSNCDFLHKMTINAKPAMVRLMGGIELLLEMDEDDRLIKNQIKTADANKIVLLYHGSECGYYAEKHSTQLTPKEFREKQLKDAKKSVELLSHYFPEKEVLGYWVDTDTPGNDPELIEAYLPEPRKVVARLN